MRLDILGESTGTVLTSDRSLACLAADSSWWDQGATQGYASRRGEPRIASLRHTEKPLRLFVVHNERGSIVCSIQEPKPVVNDVGIFWSVSATAGEIGLVPPLLADLMSLRRPHATGYLFAYDDLVKISRDVSEGYAARSSMPVAEPDSPSQVMESVWAEQLAELKQIAILTNEQLADLFAVSRTSVQDWLVGGGMRTGNREHLRQSLAILRDAFRRYGSSQRLHELLMTPVGERRLRPFDYLVEKQYAIARGYLQQRPVPDRPLRRQPIRSRSWISETVRLDRLEELNPPPRAVRDDE